MQSYASNAPNRTDFIFIDLPRASANGSTSLFSLNQDERITKKEARWGDPDYLTLISANYLVLARLARQAISSNGSVAICTNWQHYTFARTAFELSFGVKNCLGELVYQTREGGGNDAKFMSIDHESLLIFSSASVNLSPFQVPKDAKELAKYNQEDSVGPYTWDTFIRKQAKTYYPITCPDGTVLEFDENGNRISWLRGKDRFKSDLEKGEIEFRKVGDKWKLYYKDRLKESKILRSISLSSALGKDIFEELSDETAKDLLTKHGAAEVKGKAQKVPAYLKSQRYFKFIFNALAKSASHVLVPFPEHGSAALGLLASLSSADLVTTVDERYSELWEARVLSVLGEAALVDPNYIEFESMLDIEKCATTCRLLIEILAFRHGLNGGPIFFESKDLEGAIGSISSSSQAYLVYVGPSENFLELFEKYLLEDTELQEKAGIDVYATSEMPPEFTKRFGMKSRIHMIPSGTLC